MSVCACVRVWLGVCACVYLCVYMHACVCVHMCVVFNFKIYTVPNTHACAYTHTHTIIITSSYHWRTWSWTGNWCKDWKRTLQVNFIVVHIIIIGWFGSPPPPLHVHSILVLFQQQFFCWDGIFDRIFPTWYSSVMRPKIGFFHERPSLP